MIVQYIPRRNIFTAIKYGLLYNWYATQGSGVNSITSSDNWAVLSSEHFESLMLYLDPSGTPSLNTAGGKLKETGTTYWSSPNTDADNSSGMNVRGAGYRSELGVFNDTKNRGRFWNTNEQYATTAFHSYCLNNTGIFYTSNLSVGYTTYKKVGNSIRLIYVGGGSPTSYIGNDGKIYRTKTLDGVTYLADNLSETKLRSGSLIPEVTDNSAWAALTTSALCAYDNDWNNV